MAYEERYHPEDACGTKSVQGRMNAAKANDESSSGILNWLKAKEQVKREISLSRLLGLILIFSQLLQNRRRLSSSFSTSPFLITAPPSCNVSTDLTSSLMVSESYTRGA
jgi:hypothetical protein